MYDGHVASINGFENLVLDIQLIHIGARPRLTGRSVGIFIHLVHMLTFRPVSEVLQVRRAFVCQLSNVFSIKTWLDLNSAGEVDLFRFLLYVARMIREAIPRKTATIRHARTLDVLSHYSARNCQHLSHSMGTIRAKGYDTHFLQNF